MPGRLAVLAVVFAVVFALTPARAVTLDDPEPPERHEASVLVRLAPGVDRTLVHSLAGVGRVANRIPELDLDVVTVPRGTVDAALAAYRLLPGVVYAEPNVVVRLLATPNDPLVRDQYALSRVGAFAGWARYGRLWRSTGGARLAIIDTGIDGLNSEFARKVRHCRSWLSGLGVASVGCLDVNGHGTHVAGIAAATANNRRGMAGIAFDAELLVLQAFNASGSAFAADLVAAIVFAANQRATVANYSFGSLQDVRAQRDAVDYAARRGVVQVAASGNTGRAGSVHYPARYPQVIAVSATDQRDRLWDRSSTGPEVEVSAPGASVLSTLPAGLYGSLSGTSMAAPHVSGLAALLRAKGLSPAQTRDRIVRGADDLGPRGRDQQFGHGRVNVARSLG